MARFPGGEMTGYRLKSSLLKEMSEIRRPMAACRCFIIVGGSLELLSM